MRTLLALALGLAVASAAQAQPPVPSGPRSLQASDLRAEIERNGRVELPTMGLVAERFDFDHDGARVEAVIVRPADAAPHPGLVLVPGHSRTAYDMLPQAIRFARAGFATVAVSQPGYGGSAGAADFAGPRTVAALQAAAERFASQPFVDRTRLGIYGYSRGALAAASLAARTDLFKASVLGGGIYDFRAAYDQVGLAGIRANMEAEAGLSDEAIRARSPINDMAGLDGPVLIIHGDQDANAPPAQARALADRLTALGREHRLVLVPGGGHALSMNDVVVPAIEFFTRALQPPPLGGERG
ncbi:MAG: alpha/beta hydrolase family protein [Allosphingosinicella sp.]|uniref:alpha/beta hydrolase family protein n=1 Tax=Allosphingosinicella sp. TaxID=2823234 RepID=UPI00392E3298